jgi:hypothetical protein
MNFIAITYGYNQFSIFNTNVSTQPLIDCIINTCFEDLVSGMKKRMISLEKEIDGYKIEEDQVKASLKVLETSIKTEEAAIAEKLKEVNIQKDQKKGPQAKKAVTTSSDIYKVLYALKDEYHANELKLQSAITNREKMKEKKKILLEFQEKYRLLDKSNLKIELFDMNGERININTKNDIYANQYLMDRQCYELYMITSRKIFSFKIMTFYLLSFS